MNTDLGRPFETNSINTSKRIELLNSIKKINYQNALDIGTGCGSTPNEIKTNVKQIFALDINLNSLGRIKKTNQIFLINGQSEKLPFNNDFFESLFLIEVLEHVENPIQTIEEIFRVLKPGGFFYLTVPNKYFLVETHLVKIGKFKISGHYFPFVCWSNFIHNIIGTSRRFSKKELSNLVVSNKFELIGIKYMMPLYSNWKFGEVFIKPITDFMEKSFLKIFGQTLIMVFKKTDEKN